MKLMSLLTCLRNFCEESNRDLGDLLSIATMCSVTFCYLASLGVHRPECYDLLKHNCNSFSNEVVQFLTGRPIPDYIINLPSEALNR